MPSCFITDDLTFSEELCKGSGSILWQGWSSTHGKVVGKAYPNNISLAKSVYEREVSILSSLKHPNIVKYVGSYQTADSYVIVMKDGGECLFDYLESHNSFSEETLRDISKQMFTSLFHCHSNQICHGDVKLENFVISSQGRVKLLDFGLAEKIPEGQTSKAPCGSTFYRPLELIRGMGHTTKIDVWALGITLFALATGRFPFCADDEYSNVIDVALSEPDLSQVEGRYSGMLVELLRGMLQKRADDRPTVEECLESPWFA
jgi:serine/threonine protein kinase